MYFLGPKSRRELYKTSRARSAVINAYIKISLAYSLNSSTVTQSLDITSNNFSTRTSRKTVVSRECAYPNCTLYPLKKYRRATEQFAQVLRSKGLLLQVS